MYRHTESQGQLVRSIMQTLQLKRWGPPSSKILKH